MPTPSLHPFIVLIERARALCRPPLRRQLAFTLALLPAAALAQTSKMATDLQSQMAAQTVTTVINKLAMAVASATGSSKTTTLTAPTVSWSKTIGGVTYLKVLIVSSSTDPDLSSLRAAVLAAGGSVYYRYTSVTALSAMLPANKVNAIAALAEVQSISPNRIVTQTASTLEAVTGVANVRATGGTSFASNTGMTGNGIGIAVLDSGIAWQHRDFSDDVTSTSRVRQRVNFLKTGDASLVGVRDWTPGIDVSGTLYPGSPTMTAYLSRLEDTSNPKPDAYGHGSHVAAVAAGRGAYQSVDTTGIAPAASLYDVKVLDDNGYGQLSDVLAGIDWVIYNARFKNIRVLGLSLGADSTESYRTDPLTRAVRSAVAQGIVVVVAAAMSA